MQASQLIGRLFFLFMILSFGLTVKGQNKTIEQINYAGLEKLLNPQNDTVYVINFWATWCKPCVEELPTFVEVSNELSDQKVKFIFVSLDFKSQIDSRLVPFAQANLPNQKVVMMLDSNANDWIPKVNANWSGAIPATVILKKENKYFHEGELTKEALLNQISIQLKL